MGCISTLVALGSPVDRRESAVPRVAVCSCRWISQFQRAEIIRALIPTQTSGFDKPSDSGGAGKLIGIR